MEQKDKRRINWLLIKQSWSWENKAGEFNEALGVNNNVYYDIQKGQAIDVKVIKRISNKTGISEDVLIGKELLHVEEMDDEKWGKYITNLDDLYDKKHHVSNNEGIKHQNINSKVQVFRTNMKDKVLGELNSAKEGSVWYSIRYFCKYRTKYAGTTKPDVYIKNLINALEKVSWELVQSLQEEGLTDKYRETIHEQNEMLKAIVIFNKHHKEKK